MKKLFLIIFFSGSLDSFSQDKPEKLYLWPDGKYSVLDPGSALPPPTPDTLPQCRHNLKNCKCLRMREPTPDTLRAILLVTLGYRQQGIAHSRMGFVVIEQGKRPVYLDCNKRALKLPQVGWGFREVNKQ